MKLNPVAYRIENGWVASAEFERIDLRRRAGANVRTGCVSRKEAEYLLDSDLNAATIRARRALAAHPNDIIAGYLLGAALLRMGRPEEARAVLQPLAEAQPQFAAAWSELGLALQKLGEDAKATGAQLQAISFDPIDEDAWYALGNLLHLPDGDGSVSTPVSNDPSIDDAALALREERFETAETILRRAIESRPRDARALKLLADVLICTDRWAEATTLLDKSLEIAPLFQSARFRYATMLTTRKEYRAAIPHIEVLLKSNSKYLLYRLLMSIALEGSGDYERAMYEYERLLEASPDRPGLWMQYAQIVKTNRPQEAPALFDKILYRAPFLVDASYALATHKSFRFDAPWIERLRHQFQRPELDYESRARLHFAMGKAFEDVGEFESSFKHYKACNDLLREIRKPDIKSEQQFTIRAKTVITRRFLNKHEGVGCKDAGAIFVVGLPRSGSTLVEQMLSSHSAIEGLGELPDLPSIIKRLGPNPGAYPAYLKTLEFDRFRMLGEEYMALTRARRKTDKPFFTDKLPINHAHAALIHLMLPNAKIVDVRRHPLDCGFSCYKHYFPAGQERALSRRTMGRWYAEYVELMAHYDEILPGRIHRIIYEQLVENPEHEIRRLLDYLGLPFEEQCLRFHETERTVDTISAEQVRMPLYTSAVEHWRHYEKWLGPMREELGCVLDTYPQPPEFYPRLKARIAPHPLGKASFFRLIKGVRQLPFELAPRPAPSA